MASPKPRPAALKLVEGRGAGRDSGGRKVKTPPTFRRVAPVPPEWLSAKAQAEWDRVLPELTRLDLTKDLDAAALAAYCTTWAMYADVVGLVEEQGYTVTNCGKDGYEQHAPNPNVATAIKLGAQLRAWCAEFGLTPSAESKLAKPEVDDGDKAANPFA